MVDVPSVDESALYAISMTHEPRGVDASAVQWTRVLVKNKFFEKKMMHKAKSFIVPNRPKLHDEDENDQRVAVNSTGGGVTIRGLVKFIVL